MSSRMCLNCGGKESETKKLMRCSRCKQAYYCDQKCQKSFWPIHKQYCKQLVSDEYNVTPRSNRIRCDGSRREVDVRAGSDGRLICSFAPSATENQPFLQLLMKNAHVDVEGKYGFNPFTAPGRAAMATCSLSDDSPTDDVPKLIMASIVASLAAAVSTDVSGVLVLTEEDSKYYLMMKGGRKFVKTFPGTPDEIVSSMSSVVKVKFCMGNSNIKLGMFFSDATKAKVLNARDKKTIAELKRHLEKNATATDQVVSCPIRGSSRVYEGYLDMQNLA